MPTFRREIWNVLKIQIKTSVLLKKKKLELFKKTFTKITMKANTNISRTLEKRPLFFLKNIDIPIFNFSTNVETPRDPLLAASDEKEACIGTWTPPK